MLTRREFLKASIIAFPFSLLLGNVTNKTIRQVDGNGQPWTYPLTFPAYFPVGPDVTPTPTDTLTGTPTATPKPVYKQYMPIVTKNG